MSKSKTRSENCASISDHKIHYYPPDRFCRLYNQNIFNLLPASNSETSYHFKNETENNPVENSQAAAYGYKVSIESCCPYVFQHRQSRITLRQLKNEVRKNFKITDSHVAPKFLINNILVKDNQFSILPSDVIEYLPSGCGGGPPVDGEVGGSMTCSYCGQNAKTS
jgi:hypothetical protein